jgi:uncharacterized protein HemX
MTADQQILEKHLKKSSLISNTVSLVIALITALSVGYGFYYNTKSTLAKHGEEIQEVKKDVRDVNQKINDTDVFKGVSEERFKEMDEKITKMDEKLDKLLQRQGK